MQHFLSSLEYPGKDAKVVGVPDPLIVGQAEHVLHQSENLLESSMHPKTRHTHS